MQAVKILLHAKKIQKVCSMPTRQRSKWVQAQILLSTNAGVCSPPYFSLSVQSVPAPVSGKASVLLEVSDVSCTKADSARMCWAEVSRICACWFSSKCSTSTDLKMTKMDGGTGAEDCRGVKPSKECHNMSQWYPESKCIFIQASSGLNKKSII